MSDPLFAVRMGRPTDHPFVCNSWLRGDRFSPVGRDMGEVYAREHEITVRDILSRPGVQIRIAHAPDDDDALLGFAVVRPGAAGLNTPATLYYAYTKRDARRLGIAKTLLVDVLEKPVEYTSKPVIKAKISLPELWSYNPVRNYRP